MNPDDLAVMSVRPEPELLHNGLAFRNFKHTFNLAAHVKVASANLENGLLSVELVREVPEQLRPRRIELGAPAAQIAGRENGPKLVDHGEERRDRAA